MTPFIDLVVDGEWCRALRTLGDDDPGSAFVQFSNNPVGIERLVGDQIVEFDTLDQRGDADRVVSLPRKQDEAHEIAERIRQGQDFRC